jgi:hypothetical protein
LEETFSAEEKKKKINIEKLYIIRGVVLQSDKETDQSIIMFCVIKQLSHAFNR